MTIYENVKAAVTLRQAAEHYGLQVGRNNMTCCPFHQDRHPSMKLYDDHFYCFGCGAAGDVIVELLKFYNTGIDLTPQQDRVHLANGTLFLDGTLSPEKAEIVRSRLPVSYNPNAPQPEHWLHFLSELLEPEDIPTLQEYLGYCLIPSTKGQRMIHI